MKIEIKSRFDASVLFAHKCDDNTMRITVEAAVKAGVDLADANLARANLADANLARANLARANLARANLARANLARANLADAYLVDASLVCANLVGAYLARANLASANLVGAYLVCANLVGAYLAGANDVIDAGTPNGWRVVGWRRDGYLSVRVGCRDKRLDEGREYWANKADRTEVLAALDYVERIATLRGWETEAA